MTTTSELQFLSNQLENRKKEKKKKKKKKKKLP